MLNDLISYISEPDQCCADDDTAIADGVDADASAES